MVSPSSYILCCHSQKTTMNVWKWDKKEPMMRFPVKEMLSVAKLSENGGSICVAGSKTGRLIVWQVTNGQLLGELEAAHYMEITDLDISATTDMVITGGKDSKVKIWLLTEYFPTKLIKV